MLTRLALVLVFLTVASPSQEISVYPSGPIKTLAEAKDVARAQHRSGITPSANNPEQSSKTISSTMSPPTPTEVGESNSTKAQATS